MKSAKEIRSEIIDTTHATVREVVDSGRPIVIGPWLGEVGFELLYWIPFLHWIRQHVDLPADRITVLSRGGCASWYGDLAAHYAELYDHYTPPQLLTVNMARIIEQSQTARELGTRQSVRSLKQYLVTSFEHEMIARVSPDAAIIHPQLMYRLFRFFWRTRLTDLYGRCTVVKRITAPPVPEGLPERYIAVKFYTSNACPERRYHQQSINRILGKLAGEVPVVLLDSGNQYDEHGAFGIEGAQIIRPTLDPPTNLATQTAIIGGASAYIGTYGGFAYLAPLLGVRTTALYAERNFREDHYQVAVRAFTKLRVRFAVMSLGDGSSTVSRHWKRWANAA